MVSSIFVIENYETKEKEKLEVTGTGDETITFVRKRYPKFSRIVLRGFNINGVFQNVKLRKRFQ